MRPIAVDLFAGAGGMSLGFELAGFDIVAAVDVDPVHCATHSFNFPLCRSICRDVSALDGATLRGLAGIASSDIAAVFGGSPCQGFSVMGKRAADDPRNALARHFVRLVCELRPAYFAFENVPGMLRGAGHEVLQAMVRDFHSCGYRVVSPWRTLNAADAGIPQNRTRIFLIGARADRALPCYPSLEADHVCVQDAIGDLPEVDAIPDLLHRDSVGAPFATNSLYARRLRGLVGVPDDFSYGRAFDRDLLTCSRRTRHGAGQRKRFAAMAPGSRDPVSRFPRLDPRGLSPALRSGTTSDRGAFTSPRPVHPDAPRCITMREAARLHSYPDWFRFHATHWHGLRQIGNSVPPLLARAVATELLAAFGISPQRTDRVLALGDEQLLKMSLAHAAAHFGIARALLPRRTRRGSGAVSASSDSVGPPPPDNRP